MNHVTADKFTRVRELFPHTRDVVYFNSASYGPFSTLVKDIIEQNIELRVACEQDDSHDAFATTDRLRRMYADMIGAKESQIGLGLNTTHGLNIAAFGLPLAAGDEILVSDIEFPAVIYAFREAAKARGLKLTFVTSRDRRFDITQLEAAITPRTRVLALSWVQFFNGYKNDLAALSGICKQHGMYFVVDGIQGMGAEPINVPELGIDIFSSGCQKWMLAPQGCGFFYLSDEMQEKIDPMFISWLSADWGMRFSDLFHYDKPLYPSARRFEMGYYAVLNLLGMAASAELIADLGIANIQQHNHELIDRLVAYVESNPFYSVTSSLEEKHRSSIMTFTCDDHRTLQKQLVENKVILVPREGSIRVAVHLFNSESDVDRLIELLEDFARKKG